MTLTKEESLIVFKMKGTKEKNDEALKNFKADPPELQKKLCDLWKPICDEFYETEEYKSGDTLYAGYSICCDSCNFCGGMSGWVIFLIIVLVVGVLAGGAAAFWFFYWKRKNGGKEETVEENTESTENSKTVIEIPVGN